MSQLVHTTLGLVPIEELVVSDVIEVHDNVRVTATEWRKGSELVRRDVNVNVLRGVNMTGEQGAM